MNPPVVIATASFARAGERAQPLLSAAEKFLVVVFLLTLPLVNPWVRGDGVGYYAYVRSLLIDHNLRFENEWHSGNPSFVMGRVDERGNLRPDQFTPTGYVGNTWAVGPSVLWAPFLAMTHLAVVACNYLGVHIRADGYSRPYLWTMALATAFYGFLGLWLAFRLAREYFEELWACLATLGIWFASSLIVYMYFNPSWSHAHSAFAVALFLWYWHRTRGERSLGQWLLLGLISGLMVNVYYPNGVFLLVPLVESLGRYWRELRGTPSGRLAARRLFLRNLAYLATFVVALLPTLITRKILFGSALNLGAYSEMSWNWTAPVPLAVLFSANHGMLSWTPILIPAWLGLFLLRRKDRELAICLGLASVAFLYVISSYPTWHGLASFGSRFFISLTPVLVIGLAATLDRLATLFTSHRTARVTCGLIIALFTAWNLGFVFQWGIHLVPARGPISWKRMVRNQFTVVPARLGNNLQAYFARRHALMERIEQEDIEQVRSQPTGSE